MHFLNWRGGGGWTVVGGGEWTVCLCCDFWMSASLKTLTYNNKRRAALWTTRLDRLDETSPYLRGWTVSLSSLFHKYASSGLNICEFENKTFFVNVRLGSSCSVHYFRVEILSKKKNHGPQSDQGTTVSASSWRDDSHNVHLIFDLANNYTNFFEFFENSNESFLIILSFSSPSPLPALMKPSNDLYMYFQGVKSFIHASPFLLRLDFAGKATRFPQTI